MLKPYGKVRKEGFKFERFSDGCIVAINHPSLFGNVKI